MKIIIYICCALLVLSSCTNREEIDSAKEELLSEENTKNPVVDEDNTSEQIEEQDEDSSSTNTIQIRSLDTNNPLVFDRIEELTGRTSEVIIRGSVENGRSVESIEVLFSNASSEFPDDRYALQTFQSGDDTFRYNASTRNQVLDIGENIYIFRAIADGEVFETEIRINLPESELSGSGQVLVELNENIFETLPVSTDYGQPVRLGESSFSYSDIKGLEISSENIEVFTCEKLTEYLGNRLSSWYYWNTCRSSGENALRYNVIRLDGEEYIYERHYVDFENGLYGVYELERGTGVDSEGIEEKNTELRDKEFETVTIVDELMRDIAIK